ncbi:MAG: DUF4249 domain-containing protein [Mucilaginibacter sp.]
MCRLHLAWHNSTTIILGIQMRLIVNISLVLIGASSTFLGCKRVYAPPATSTDYGYLVVEGVVDAGSDSTIIKLSRTVKISGKNNLRSEYGAIVAVESEQNIAYPLTEATNGSYVSTGLNLDNTHKYRLHIKTTDGKEYKSDLVQVVNSPPIDSVNYVVGSKGVNVYVNTHDPKNDTHYYRWDYQETWIIFSYYKSFFKSIGDTVVARDFIDDNIYQCWKSDTSSDILLGSSTRLKSDVIAANPVIFIADTSEKFLSGCSIRVKQYALTADAFNFWTALRKNTEKIGTVFDTQPSEIQGNIHSISNPGEPVIGYVSVGSTSNTRMFIHRRNLPNWTATLYYPYCQIYPYCCQYQAYRGPGLYENQVDEFMNYNGSSVDLLIPIDAKRAHPEGPILGFTTTTIRGCVDCTTRGTNKQPAFWQN